MRHSTLTLESSLQWSCIFRYGPLPIWNYCDDTWQVQSKTLSSDKWGNRGHAVAQLVEALHYKLEGHRFESQWCHWNFSLTWSFRLYYGPGVDSDSNRNEYQEYFLGVKAAGAQDWHYHFNMLSRNLGASNSWNPQGLSRPVMGLIHLYLSNEETYTNVIYIYIYIYDSKLNSVLIKYQST